MEHTELLGTYTLTWPDGVFPLGGDALALGRFASVRPGWKVCDLGTGSGALLLLLAERTPSLLLHGIDRDPLSAQTARENMERNGLRADILTADLRNAPFPAGGFDLVVANPPYFPVGSGTSGGSTRAEETCTLDELCMAAARLVKNGGRFALCHRPERLTDLLCTLRKHDLEPKRLQMLAYSPAHVPSTVLVEAVRQGRPGLDMLPTRFVQP